MCLFYGRARRKTWKTTCHIQHSTFNIQPPPPTQNKARAHLPAQSREQLIPSSAQQHSSKNSSLHHQRSITFSMSTKQLCFGPLTPVMSLASMASALMSSAAYSPGTRSSGGSLQYSIPTHTPTTTIQQDQSALPGDKTSTRRNLT